MVYGYYITDTAGNKRFFVEGCKYCSMSTGGQHEDACPYKTLAIDYPIIHNKKKKKPHRQASHAGS